MLDTGVLVGDVVGSSDHTFVKSNNCDRGL